MKFKNFKKRFDFDLFIFKIKTNRNAMAMRNSFIDSNIRLSDNFQLFCLSSTTFIHLHLCFKIFYSHLVIKYIIESSNSSFVMAKFEHCYNFATFPSFFAPSNNLFISGSLLPYLCQYRLFLLLSYQM
jgi:hypothetical protein